MTDIADKTNFPAKIQKDSVRDFYIVLIVCVYEVVVEKESHENGVTYNKDVIDSIVDNNIGKRGLVEANISSEA